ncbi:Pleckstrin homology domain, partial [Rhizoctonia solani]
MSPSLNSPVPTLTTQPSIYSPQPVYHPNVRSPSLHSQNLSDFGSPSKVPSLVGSSITRDPSSVASNSTTGYLPTPTDDVMHMPPSLARDETTLISYYRNQAFPEHFRNGKTGKSNTTRGLGGSRTRQGSLSIRRGSPSRTRPESDKVSASGKSVSTVEGTSPTRDPAPPMPPRMERQQGTRELISRYEILDSIAHTPPATSHQSQGSTMQRPRSTSQLSRRDFSLPPVPPANPSPTRSQGEANVDRRHAPHSHRFPESSSYFSTFAQKGGKLRNSFTNLVQLLGDKAKSGSRKRNSVSPSVSPGRMLNALPKGFKLRLSKRASAGSSPSSSPGKDGGGSKTSDLLPNINELLNTEPIISALLLYQSPARQVHPSIPDQKTPLWMPYTVSLYPTTIILQVPNPGLSSSSKFQIPLSELYDAHSVLAKDLLPGLIPSLGSICLPPAFGDEIYAFEALCYGGRIERFAAPTMASRAAWVRHLIDILTGHGPSLKNKAGKLDGVQGGEALVSGTTPMRSLTCVQGLPSVSSIVPVSSSPGSTPGMITLVGDNADSTKSVIFTSNPKSSVEGFPKTHTRSSTPITPSGRALSSRLDAVGDTPQTASVFPNPWEPPATPTRRATSGMTQRGSSLLMSPRSDRSRITASPSICRLDERNLVRDRLAMFEHYTSPSPSARGSISSRRGKEGTVNWEVLSEVRNGRSGTVLNRAASNLRDPSARPSPAVGQETPMSSMRIHRDDRSSFGPGRPALELKPRVSPVIPSDSSVKSNRSTFMHNDVPRFSFLTDRNMESNSKPIQVLGNLRPSKQVETTQLQLSPSSMIITQDSSLKPIMDRLDTLLSALRESDATQSTKASGLGQLIVSTQDYIVRNIEDDTKKTSAEYLTLLKHTESLGRMIESLIARPALGYEERDNLIIVREAIERIEQDFFTRAEMISSAREKEFGEDMKAFVSGQSDGLRQTIQDLVAKLDHGSKQNEVLAKLDTLTLAATSTCNSAARDVDLLAEFVAQVKDHISSLPTSSLDTSTMDTSKILDKLDSLSHSMIGSDAIADLSAIRTTLENIKTHIQPKENSNAITTLSSPQADISDLSMKLDGITAMCQSIMADRATVPDVGDGPDNPIEVAQQTELNVWLEKFVTNASMQMDNVRDGLVTLRQDLGLESVPKGQEAHPQGVIQELHTMLEEQVKSAGDIASSLNALLVSFNEEQARNAQARESLATDAVLKMIEVQRQEQERLLEQLASDLSSDIRGERIRFVEAMSQATSMNVQLHVEEFKKQLTHEVLALTDEVGRLREERKTIQHQIAQLFMVKSEHESEPHGPNQVGVTKSYISWTENELVAPAATSTTTKHSSKREVTQEAIAFSHSSVHNLWLPKFNIK